MTAYRLFCLQLVVTAAVILFAVIDGWSPLVVPAVIGTLAAALTLACVRGREVTLDAELESPTSFIWASLKRAMFPQAGGVVVSWAILAYLANRSSKFDGTAGVSLAEAAYVGAWLAGIVALASFTVIMVRLVIARREDIDR